jgi:hypothetical protein
MIWGNLGRRRLDDYIGCGLSTQVAGRLPFTLWSTVLWTALKCNSKSVDRVIVHSLRLVGCLGTSRVATRDEVK